MSLSVTGELLPFADFLMLLRGHGIPVDLKQYEDVTKLCQRLGATPGCTAAVMAQALAGLLGSSKDEVALIQRLFEQHYADAYLYRGHGPSVPEGVKLAQVERAVEEAHKPPRRIRWMLGSTVLLLLALLLSGWLLRSRFFLTQFSKSPIHIDAQKEAESAPPPVPPEPSSQRDFSKPELPPAPILTHRLPQVLWVVPLLLFLWRYLGRRRADLRAWAVRVMREARDRLGGPAEPTLRLTSRSRPFERQDLDDMATILGRGSDLPLRGEIDGERTVQRTIEQGLLPSLVFNERATFRSVLVLCDLGREMYPWRFKTEALVQGLVRRGVDLSYWYFDGDAQKVSQAPFGRTVPLDKVLRQHPDAGLLVLSTGQGLLPRDAERRREGKVALWLDVVRRHRQRAWLHPVTDPALWHDTLRQPTFPLRVLPMTRHGLVAAAYELAQEADRRTHISDDELRPLHPVRSEHLRKMHLLLSVYRDAPVELADLLRKQFYPDIPEDVLVPLCEASTDYSYRTLSYSQPEVARFFAALQAGDAHLPPAERLEERARLFVLAILKQSEPKETEILAHMRWRLDYAMQQIYLHDEREQIAATKALKELARGPLCEEVEAAVRLLDVPARSSGKSPPSGAGSRLPLAPPVVDEIRREVEAMMQKTASDEVAVPSGTSALVQSEGMRPGWLRLPSLGELAIASVCIAVLSLLAGWRRIGQEQTQHEPRYEIAYRSQSHLGDGILTVTAKESNVPSSVSWYRDNRPFAPVNRLARAPSLAEVLLPPESQPHHYHVRAALPKGNLAYSLAVLVPAFVAPPAPKPPPDVNQPAPMITTTLDSEGQIRIIGEQWVRFRLDQEKSLVLGVTPSVLKVRSGRHNIAYLNGSREVTVVPGKTADVQVPATYAGQLLLDATEAFSTFETARAQLLLDRARALVARGRGPRGAQGEVLLLQARIYDLHGAKLEAMTQIQNLLKLPESQLRPGDRGAAFSVARRLADQLGRISLYRESDGRCLQEEHWVRAGEHQVDVGSGQVRTVRVREGATVKVTLCQ